MLVLPHPNIPIGSSIYVIKLKSIRRLEPFLNESLQDMDVHKRTLLEGAVPRSHTRRGTADVADLTHILHTLTTWYFLVKDIQDKTGVSVFN